MPGPGRRSTPPLHHRAVALPDRYEGSSLQVASGGTTGDGGIDVHEQRFDGWSPDGSWLAISALAALDPATRRIFAIGSAGGEAFLVSRDPTGFVTEFRWSPPSGHHLLYREEGGERPVHRVVSFGEGGPRAPLEISGYDVVVRVGPRRLFAMDHSASSHLWPVVPDRGRDRDPRPHRFVDLPHSLSAFRRGPRQRPSRALAHRSGPGIPGAPVRIAAGNHGHVRPGRPLRRSTARPGLGARLEPVLRGRSRAEGGLYESEPPPGSSPGLRRVADGVFPGHALGRDPWSASARFYVVPLLDPETGGRGLALRDVARDRFDIIVPTDGGRELEHFGFEGTPQR